MSHSVSTDTSIVTFLVNEQRYAIATDSVRSIIPVREMTYVPGAPGCVAGIINLRGQIIAVVDLAKRLNIEAGEMSGDTRIIVVEGEDIKVGMIVDSGSEVLRVSADAVEPSPTLATDISAVYLQGVVKQDNRLIILLDLTKVLSLDEMAGLGL